VSEKPDTIRSYQRVFRPERRIYSIDGRPLPVPGGVPLRWLAYATGAVIANLLIASGSTTISILIAAAAAVVGFSLGGRTAAAMAATFTFVSLQVAGPLLGLLDWPLRLIVLPVAVATLATQATPDGRRAERFAFSWLSLRLRPGRTSIGRPLPGRNRRHPVDGDLWVAVDRHSSNLRRSRVKGPAEVTFAEPVEERKKRGRRIVRRLGWHRRKGEITEKVTLRPGEVLEVRP
jgi:hypothetical protein